MNCVHTVLETGGIEPWVTVYSRVSGGRCAVNNVATVHCERALGDDTIPLHRGDSPVDCNADTCEHVIHIALEPIPDDSLPVKLKSKAEL